MIRRRWELVARGCTPPHDRVDQHASPRFFWTRFMAEREARLHNEQARIVRFSAERRR